MAKRVSDEWDEALAAARLIFNVGLEAEVEVMSAFFSSTDYQGYAPEKTRAQTYINYVKYKAAHPEIQTYKNYIVFMLIFYLNRGTKLGDKFANNSTEGCVQLMGLCRHIFLIQESSKSNRAPHIVTLSRIANSFPEVVGEILARFPTKVKKIDHSEFIPVYLQFPGAIAIIPTKLKILINHWKVWNAHYTKLIDKRKKSWDIEKVIRSQNTYTDAAGGSGLFDNTEREIIVKKLETILSTGAHKASGFARVPNEDIKVPEERDTDDNSAIPEGKQEEAIDILKKMLGK